MATILALALLGSLLGGGAVAASFPAADAQLDDELSLLQRNLGVKAGVRGTAEGSLGGNRDLAFMHIPFNFGHSVEQAAMFGMGPLSAPTMLAYMFSMGGFGGLSRRASWSEVRRITRAGGEVWGHLNPDLQAISNVTGCPLYYTPQKYWPKSLAQKYFGNKTIFGILRDPYERLVAMARGMVGDYGGGKSAMPHMLSCDVNGAVKQMLKDFLAGGDKFGSSCTFVPQAEYFDGPYGITLPVNNREYPTSMNKVFLDHDYPDFQMKLQGIFHVVACPSVWAGDLDAETRSLIKQVYKRDFDLLCKHFGYCDNEENACIYQVPMMCPKWLMRQGYRGHPLPNTVGGPQLGGGAQVPSGTILPGTPQLLEEDVACASVEAEDVLRIATKGGLPEDVIMRLATNRTLLESILQVISES